MTDGELVQRHRKGDGQAFNFLVWRYQTPVYNYCLRYTGSRDEALDLAQRSFMKSYDALDQLKDPERYGPWLYQIAVNQCRDHSRNRYHQRKINPEDEQQGLLDGVSSETSGDNPHWVTEQAQLQEILGQALTELPEEQRSVVILKEYQGFTFRDIAGLLGQPENTVKSRLYYGLRTLRKILIKWNIDKELLDHEL